MARKLIVCCDGTWGQTEPGNEGRLLTTNVFKFARALLPVNHSNDSNQITYYDPGGRTGSSLNKLLASTLGTGIENCIHNAYRFLAVNYAPGDEIYCLGFSRGAYTVRALCGFIDTVGLLTKEDLDYIPEAYTYYQTSAEKRGQDKFLNTLNLIQDAKEADRFPRIHFVGVWDTVGTFGIPAQLLKRIPGISNTGLHDTNLAENVDNAYQAIAIDEQRGVFHPNLWTDSGTSKRLLQVWFTGTHSNIGGGYADSGLSDITLNWMIEQAQQHGLVFDETFLKEKVKPDYKGQIDDSYSKLYKTLEKFRVKPFIRHPNQAKYGISSHERPINEFIHPSVINRWHDSSAYYRPENLSEAILAEIPVYQAAINTPTLNDAERRLRLRSPLSDVNGTLSINGHTQSCQLLDISKGRGVRVSADILMPAGCDISINSELTGQVSGRVMWTRDHQAGIRIAA